MEEEIDSMVFKDDDGYWRLITTADVGTPTNKFNTLEELIDSLPQHLKDKIV